MPLRRKVSRKLSFRRRSSPKRVRQRSAGIREKIGGLKVKAKQLLKRMTPEELTTYKAIQQRYETEVGNTSNRSLESLSDVEKTMAQISQQAYLFVSKKKNTYAKRTGELTIVPELSDDNSVVYENGDLAVIGYRGTIPSKIGDLVADYHITFGTTSESKRFQAAEAKYQAVKNTGKYREIQVTGHSLGGAQAIHIAKLFGLECWAWNPGQGVSKDYLNDSRIFPKIRTYHILGDPISDTAGLENPSSVFVFPAVSSVNPLANHSLDNFLA